MPEAKKPKSPVVLIKDFFGLSAKEAMDLVKGLPAPDKEQLAQGIKDGSLTY